MDAPATYGRGVQFWLDFRSFAGAKGQTRTADRTIFSRELYQLSYLGEGGVTMVGDRGLEPLTSTV